MDAWLDTLSEDWDSQPRSSTPASIQQSTSAEDTVAHASNGPQSRIPRFKARSSSSSAIITPSRRKTTNPKDTKEVAVLAEKTPSNMNTLINPVPSGFIRVQQDHPASVVIQSKTRHGSFGSMRLAQEGTVQHIAQKIAPNQKENGREIPDWRRILKNNGGGGDQHDLFSPIGLERIFKSPNIPGEPRQMRGKRIMPIDTGNLPSSPPPYPSPILHKSTKPISKVRARQALVRAAAEAMEEEEDIVCPSSTSTQAQARQYKEWEESKEKDQRKVSSFDKPYDGSPKATERIGQRVSSLTTHSPDSVSHTDALVRSYSKVLESSDGTHLKTSTNGISDEKSEDISPVNISMRVGDDVSIRNGADECRDDAIGNISYQHRVTDGKRIHQFSTPADDYAIPLKDSETAFDTDSRDTQLSGLLNQSLPEDLSTGTQDYTSITGFADLRRVDPPSGKTYQPRISNSSSLPLLETSRVGCNITSSLLPPRPTTPDNKLPKAASSPCKPKSPGSPLKLFDKYDTFTNERLTRRMSEFEQDYKSDCVNGRTEVRGRPYDRNPIAWGKSGMTKRINSFGQGQLDRYEFEQQHIRTTSMEHILSDGSEDEIEVQSHSLNLSQSHFRFARQISSSSIDRIQATERVRNHVKRRERTEHPRMITVSRTRPITARNITVPKEPVITFEGKRPPVSPVTNLNPKRRRIRELLENIPPESQEMGAQRQENSQQIQSIIGRKRKDARYDDDGRAMDPKMIAMRQILRPRTPTPNQSRYHPQKEHAEALTQSRDFQDNRKHDFQGEDAAPDAPTQALAGKLANFALDIANEITCGNRKASVTTQDFFNEAQQIMQHIRARGRPQSGLNSANDSGIDNLGNIEESTQDEFSRPPSRERGSIRRLRLSKQPDARILSHLRKFEEKDENSIANIASSTSPMINEHEKMSWRDENQEEVESDPPNVRIIEHPQEPQEQRYSNLSTVDAPALVASAVIASQNSQPSSGLSTQRSLPTGSSSGSGNRAIIPPEKVSHLISGEVAGMTFDHARQVWVKRKSSDTKSMQAVSVMTEDDPLGSIPDLSVDELEELHRMKTAAHSLKDLGSVTKGIITSDHARAPEIPGEELNRENRREFSAPSEIGATKQLAEEPSSAPSKVAGFAFSEPKTETRATSWAEDMLTPKHLDSSQQAVPMPCPAISMTRGEEVEHEISILEGRESRTPLRKPIGTVRQARVVTVAFSSPLASYRQEAYSPSEHTEERHDESILDIRSQFEDNLGDGSKRGINMPKASTSIPLRATLKSNYRGASRRPSIGNRSYLSHPISRIDEDDELSFIQPQSHVRGPSYTVALTTPVRQPKMPRKCPIPPPSNMSRHSNVSFHLSPLPDFTVNQPDEILHLDVGGIAQRGGLLSITDINDISSLATENLIKTLTDVEPFEPYWECIRGIDLSHRGLQTLHMLEDFCSRIEELDASNNELGQLTGLPYSLRHLNIRHNYMTDLSAWGHLHNLQYLDVSGNRLQSLRGFNTLIHLRELTVDGNEIQSLDGIYHLDGLMKLSLKRNAVTSIDLRGNELHHLVALDLEGNKLQTVRNLHCLPALESLNLSTNNLEEFCEDSAHLIPALRSLNLANNRLAFLNVSRYPGLKHLKLDDNRLPIIHGLRSVKHLETLAWREQSLHHLGNRALIQYNDCHEMRKIFLSGNLLPTFLPRVDFLNLQRLELASSGLKGLPPDFGSRMANVRVLNLNFNAVKDIRPLQGVMKLEELYLTGNRLSRLRRTATVLANYCRGLANLDLRGNPLTVGFYASAAHRQAEVVGHQIVAKNRIKYKQEEDQEVTFSMQHILPRADQDIDVAYYGRLDDDTRLRRRVYEILIASGCKWLETLDGLPFDRRKVRRKDKIWDRLFDLGVLRTKEGNGEGDDE